MASIGSNFFTLNNPTVQNLSIRPSYLVRMNNAIATTTAGTNTDFAIIGDTASCILYARRMLNNGVTGTIHIIIEGSNRINVDGIEHEDFNSDSNLKILEYLLNERIHHIPSSDDYNDYDGGKYLDFTEKCFRHHPGAGPMGDWVSAYHIPRMGPWFPQSMSDKFRDFIYQFTFTDNLSDVEVTVKDTFRTLFNVGDTNKLRVNAPAIFNLHRLFITPYQDRYARELFLDEFQYVHDQPNVNIYTESNFIQFQAPSNPAPGVFNMTFNSSKAGGAVSLANVFVVFKTNPFTFNRITAQGFYPLNPNLNPLKIPTFYRCVFAIPDNNTNPNKSGPGPTGTPLPGFQTPTYPNYLGVDLTQAPRYGDYITTHLTWSLYDLDHPNNSTLCWLGQSYTTKEDFSVVEQAGSYSDSNYSLLIIEAVNTINKRKVYYDLGLKENQVIHNGDEAEALWKNQFAYICNQIYQCYVGLTGPATIDQISVCTQGACVDGDFITDEPERESPMVSILQMSSQLYSSEIYPAVTVQPYPNL